MLIGAGFSLLEGDTAQTEDLLRQVPMAHQDPASREPRSLRMNPDIETLTPAALRDRCRNLPVAKQRAAMLRAMLVAGYALWRARFAMDSALISIPQPEATSAAKSVAADDVFGDVDADALQSDWL